MTHTLHLGDCRTVLATLDDNSIDSIVCDPPYELGFMGKAWDNSGIAYDVTVWQQCYRVLKPGGHLIAFGGSRTYHRLAVAIEDAGFEIRDQIQWIYGSGFPKSHNLKDEWKGFGTALKPAHEPAVLARKPLCGTVADNVTTWGVGALNIDATRIATDDDLSGGAYGGVFSGSRDEHGNLPKAIGSGDKGRWPANVIFDEEAAQILNEQSGERKTGGVVRNNKNEKSTVYSGGWKANTATGHSDSGGASRFFYVAKASKAEREAGLGGDAGRWPANVIFDEEAAQVLDEQSGHSVSSASMRRNNGTDSFSRGKFVPFAGIGHSDSGGASRFFYVPKASKSEREAGLDAPDGGRANIHTTVKPIALMRYLVRLVTPKGGKVLDPFMGSGSTGCAAVLEGCDFVGIDITPEYVAIAQKRIAHYAVETPLEGLL